MDPHFAWRQWRTSLGGGDGGAVAVPFYPWSVLRFLNTWQKKRLEDYTERDLREFLDREAAGAYEWRHYEWAVRSFFSWCRQLAGLPQASGSASPSSAQAASWLRLQPLLRLVVLIVYVISVEGALAVMIVRLAH
jgi:hypothetical protein